jgi:hypothetical protein
MFEFKPVVETYSGNCENAKEGEDVKGFSQNTPLTTLGPTIGEWQCRSRRCYSLGARW